MKLKEVLNKYNISDATIRNWKKLNYIKDINNIQVEEIEAVLKHKTGVRRNKRNSSKSIIPTSYIEDKKIIDIITIILELKEKYNISNNEIIHETIIRLLKDRNLNIPNEIENVLGSRTDEEEFLESFNSIKLEYEEDNDFLGCLYMSLLSVGEKDIEGIFYTPYKVAKKIVESINFEKDKLVLDPGCGSANFLIQIFKVMHNNNVNTADIVKCLYGYDTDELAVLLAKVNIYILDKNIIWDNINIYKKDYLYDKSNIKFDIVIGNPPWGKKYLRDEKKKLKDKYGLDFSKMDSFAQFIYRSFEVMNDGGILGFVLPSSFLNIATHEYIRRFVLNYKIDYIQKIGREFEEVVTDVLIFKVEKVSVSDNEFLYDDVKVNQTSFLNNPYCSFLITDDISKGITNKIKKHKSFHLTDGVEYALGIVTGDNGKYLSNEKTNDNELIISGKDISRYNINYDKVGKYIVFDKDSFQQVAKESLYRNKNKIVYKFIGKVLCFAAETKGSLTLNSANIICLPKEYDLYYITAILNSRITQLYFEDTYNTHKVLKNHIQSFYIPIFDEDVMKKISDICKNIKDENNYCEEIEELIYSNLKLTKKEIEYLKNRF